MPTELEPRDVQNSILFSWNVLKTGLWIEQLCFCLVCVCVYACLSACAPHMCRALEAWRVTDLVVEVELQEDCELPDVDDSQYRSSARAPNVLNYWAISNPHFYVFV